MRKLSTWYRIAVVSLIVQCDVAIAQDDGRGQSIMFEQDRRYLTEKPPQDDTRWERCRELSRQVEALKGKPQRRYAAAQRYEAECKAPRQ